MAKAPKTPSKRGEPTIQAGGEEKDAAYEPRMKTDYKERVRKSLKDQFGYTNEMQVPKLEKIVVNMGIGEAVSDTKKAQNAMNDLALITGQKPMATKARKSIAGFKLREGMVVGAKVTLRKARMYEFGGSTPWASGNTWCFRRSTTTRSIRSGAWTSSSAPPPRPTTKRARF